MPWEPGWGKLLPFKISYTIGAKGNNIERAQTVPLLPTYVEGILKRASPVDLAPFLGKRGRCRWGNTARNSSASFCWRNPSPTYAQFLIDLTNVTAGAGVEAAACLNFQAISTSTKLCAF